MRLCPEALTTSEAAQGLCGPRGNHSNFTFNMASVDLFAKIFQFSFVNIERRFWTSISMLVKSNLSKMSQVKNKSKSNAYFTHCPTRKACS